MSFGEWVIRYRWQVIVVVLLVVGVAGSGVRFLYFNSDYRVFFSERNPQLQAFETLQNVYSKNDNILIALAPEDGNVFTRSTLAAIEELTRASWQVPYSTRVDSITNYQHTRAEGDDLVVEDLIKNAPELAVSDLELKRRIALAEPLLVRRLISPSAHMSAINIVINLPDDKKTEVPKVAAFVRNMAGEFSRKYPHIKVYLSGVVMMNNQFVESVLGDIQTLVPLMYLMVIGVMLALIRSVYASLVTVLIILFSDLTALGLAGWNGMYLTTVSSFSPTMILSLAVADSIHILITTRQEMKRGVAKNRALVESLRFNMKPVFLTSLTTAIGFLSLNFSDIPPYRHLGNIVAMGVGSAYLYSIFFLPAAMSLLPIRVKATEDRAPSVMERFGSWVVRRREPLFWGMLVLIVALALPIPRNEINDNFIEYFDTRFAFRTDSDYITENLTGFMFIDFSLEAGEPGGVANPAYLRKLEEFADWCRSQPEVLYVNTLTDVMKRLNKNLHGDDAVYYRIPQSRELTAQYLLLYEMSLPYGLDLNNQINIDKSSTRFSVILKNVSSKELIELEARAKAWLNRNAPASMHVDGASPLLMFAHISKRNAYSMLGGTAFAIFLISAVLTLALGSLKYGAISLITNLFPAALAFGVWGMGVGQVGMAASLVTAMSLGIVVDDTVHFISKYLYVKRVQGLNAREAVLNTFKYVGVALWVTSLILVLGFFVLNFSGFLVNAQMGLLTGIAIIFALMVDFLFLPPLLMKLEDRSSRSGRGPESRRSRTEATLK